MTQIFNVSIDGVDVTHEKSTCTVSEEVNRIYDVATVTIKKTDDAIMGKEMIINYGDKTFTGFVYSSRKTGKNMLRVEARTYSAKLTEPYSPHEKTVDDATTSHELCALYASESGVPISISAVDLDFGGSYERNGTMLSALLNIASATGAEYYEQNGTVVIEPNKAIDSEGVVIPESDIFDFVEAGESVYNKGVGFVTVQNGGDDSSDVISKNSIYAEIDECSGEVFIFTNPFGEAEYTTGLSSLRSVLTERKEDRGLLDEDVVRLDGAIESIVSVKLNGSEISDYGFEQGHNVLYFSTLMRGTLDVTYSAYAYSGYCNISTTPIGRFISFDVYYLDQALKFQGFLSPNCGNASTDGDITCIVPSEMYYNAGFDMWTIGGDPEFSFYNRSDEIYREVTSTAGSYTSVENATLEETVSGYRYRTRYDLDTALGARSAGVDVNYTTSSDADGYYFEFTQYYPKLSVSYETDATMHHVEFEKIQDGDITMAIKNKNTDQVCEYDLDDKIPCELDREVPVDIATEIGVDVTKMRGVTVTYLDPTGDSHSEVIDDFGFINVYVFIDGDYVIDTSSVKKRTSVTLTSNVNG